MGAVVLAISIDSPFTHQVWQETELAKMIPGGLPYPMLSATPGCASLHPCFFNLASL